uniref:Uncharacterized protein n=1 Tax=Rhizophora mucronata TaxID=61149 RepID=A0A2P2MSG5_RHIMU
MDNKWTKRTHRKGQRIQRFIVSG